MKIKNESNKINLAIAPIGWTNDDDPSLGARYLLDNALAKWLLRDLKDAR